MRRYTRSKLVVVAVLVAGLFSTAMATSASAGVQWGQQIDSFDGTAGTAPSLALRDDGAPVVTYFNPDTRTVNVARCFERTCRTGGTIHSPISIPTGNAWPAVRLNASGNPVIAYYKEGRIELLRCDDPSCAPGGDTTNVVASEPGLFGWPDIALNPGGFPVITYIGPDSIMRIRACETRTCSVVSDFSSVDGRILGDIPVVEMGADGLPIIALTTWSGDGQPTPLRVIRCLSARCTGTTQSAEVAGWFRDPSLAIQSAGAGQPYTIHVGAVIGQGGATRDLILHSCSSEDCSNLSQHSGPTLRRVRSPYVPDLALSSSGKPVFAYADFDLTGNVHVASVIAPTPGIVQNVTDDIYRIMSPDPGSAGFMWPEIEIHSDDTTTVAYISYDGLNVTTCDDVACIPTCNGLPVTVDVAAGGELGVGHREAVVYGTDGPDSISGFGKVICGRGGDDYIVPGVVDSKVFAGAGNDVVYLAEGKGFISGGPGNDRLTGSPGLDRIFGGPGRDTLTGGAGTDRLSGGDGNDNLDGGHGNDKLFGNLGRDTIDGGPGDDIIKGGAWIDTVDGGPGEDRCGIVEGEIRENCELGVFGI